MKVRVIVSGRVQGVGYRFWTRRTAKNLGLNCEVRNLETGQVEAFFKGPEEKINQMLEKCQKGPPLAKVENIEVENLTN